MRYWLMKTEPGDYSIDDLKRDDVTCWSGVRNYQARNLLREQKLGDRVLIYHSSAGEETGVVGVGEVVREAYPDPTQFDRKSRYYDEASSIKDPRWSAVDIGYVKHLKRPLLLSVMRTMPALKAMQLLQKGSRLSVVRVTKEEFRAITVK